jgi:hypothetical protein
MAASHHVFASFVPKYTFSAKRVIGNNVKSFDPKRHVTALDRRPLTGAWCMRGW